MAKDTGYIKVIFGCIVLVLIVVTFITYWNLNNYTEEVKWVRHSGFVLSELDNILSVVKDAETGQRGYQLTHDTTFLRPYYASVETIYKRFNKLDSLISGQELQRTKKDSLKAYIDNQYKIIESILMTEEVGKEYMNDYKKRLLMEGKENMVRIRGIVSDMSNLEEDILNQRLADEHDFRRITPLTFLLFALLSLGGALLLFLNVNDELKKRKKAELKLKENLVALHWEVSTREFVERSLRSVLESSVNGIVAFRSLRDKDNRIIDFECVFSNTVGALMIDLKEKDLVNKRLLSIIPDPDLFKTCSEVTETGVTHQFEKQLFKKNDVNNWYFITVVKLDDGFVITFYDITEQKLQAEDLKRSNQDLEQFAYIASHDLQEPLRKIRAFGDRLETKYKDKLEDTGADYIDRMQHAAERMQNLIQDLLAFSRISRNGIVFQPVDLNVVARDVLEDMETSIEQTNARFTIGTLPLVQGDAVQLKRLFQNLISNAVKFHKHDIAPEIEISASRRSRDNIELNSETLLPGKEYYRISIKDNGIGFDEKYSEKIFNVFQRLHGISEYEGTGIGLAICRKIMNNHGGFIMAKSQENIGSEFIVILPV